MGERAKQGNGMSIGAVVTLGERWVRGPSNAGNGKSDRARGPNRLLEERWVRGPVATVEERWV